jgi:cob(I)alamin adenosyltransferase
MAIYTRAGDRGETRLAGGPPVGKDAPRLEALGTVDELSAAVGLVRAEPLAEDVDRLLGRVQEDLQRILAELGAVGTAAEGAGGVGPAEVRALEEAVDRYQEGLPPLGEFIVPGGVRPAAQLQSARTVCRRAERRLVTLLRAEAAEISPSLTAYMNRLGDLLFVLARVVDQQAGRRKDRCYRPAVTGLPQTWREFKRFKQQLRDTAVQDAERRFLAQTLERFDGNVTRAAEAVGMQRTNFHALMRKYGLSPETGS